MESTTAHQQALALATLRTDVIGAVIYGSSDAPGLPILFDRLDRVVRPAASMPHATSDGVDRAVLTNDQVRALAFKARQHETTSKRSNSGRTVQTVVRHGRSTVSGTHADLPLGSALALGRDVRERVNGLSAADVLRVTESLYGDAIPALLGTDHASWSEVIPTDLSADVSRFTLHANRDMFGALLPALNGAAHTAIGRPSTKTHGARIRIGRRRRDIERDTTRAWVRVDHDGIAIASGLTECHADHTDPRYRWHGHNLVRRPATVREVRAARRADRVDSPETADVTTLMVDSLPTDPPTVSMGATVTITMRGTTIRIRRTASGVAVTLSADGWRLRITRRTIGAAWRAAADAIAAR